MKVYVTQGEHPNVPGCPLSVHATHAGASAAAVDLVNLILADTVKGWTKSETRLANVPKPATDQTWPEVVDWLGSYHGEAHCWVSLTEHELEQGAAPATAA